MHGLLKNLVSSTHIAVDDVLVVIKFVNVALPSAVVALNARKDPLILNDSLRYRSTAPRAVIVVHNEVAAMVRVVNHLEVKNSTIAPDLNVGLAGVVEYCCEPKEDVRFLVLDNGCFVVPVAKDQ
jgi:hypothetical protein